MTKPTDKALTNPAELLKQQLAEQNQRIAQSDSVMVRMKAGVGFTDPGGNEGKSITIIVVDYTLVHAFYPKPYDEDKIVPPDCYANHRLFAELVPVEGAPDPQAEACMICPQNKFKSAPNGKAKACKNTRLLAILALDNPGEAPVWKLSVPPGATGRWDAYTKMLAKNGLSAMFVSTEITLDYTKDFIAPHFKMGEALDEDTVNQVIARLPEARELLDQIPDWEDE